MKAPAFFAIFELLDNSKNDTNMICKSLKKHKKIPEFCRSGSKDAFAPS